MPRPLCKKIVGNLPKILEFLPAKVPENDVIFNELSPEEFESLRLCEIDECDMKKGATTMGVSAPTFCRLRKRALKKVIDSLCSGKGIRISRECG